ncbi:MAG TPA: hypothetical protein VIH82_12925 [Acidimicrobiia bacterium]|jgi:hypothetical protein
MEKPTRPVARRLGGAIALAVLAVVLAPDPAAAHGVGGIKPTNYETVITGMEPAVPGLIVRSVDLGDRLELTNHTGRDVVVLGYDDEPYLRVGPRGVFENTRSPATYVNRTLRGTTPVPDRADPEAPPEWRRIGDEPVARWHDHRSHWTARRDAPAVRSDPDHRHVVQRFGIELRDGRRLVAVTGEIRWVPATSAWLWLALAFVLAAFVVAVSRTTVARLGLSVALVVVIAAQSLHVVGSWGATTLGIGTRLGASVYALGAIGVSVVALVWLWRRGVHTAAPLVLLAGLFVAIAGGLADVTVLTRSQLPTTLDDDLARGIVAAALGLGVGLAVAGALRLRPDRRARGRQPADDASWPSTQSWHSSSSVA